MDSLTTKMVSIILAGILLGWASNALSTKIEEIANIRSLDALKPYLETNDPSELRVAILTTRVITDRRIPDILEKLWRGDDVEGIRVNRNLLDSPKIRIALASVLLELNGNNGDGYRSLIYKELNNPDFETRGYAASALGSVGTEKAVNELISLIRKDHFFVGLNAVGALKVISFNRPKVRCYSIHSLEELASDKEITNEMVKQDIRDALKKIQKNIFDLECKDLEK